MVGNSKFYSNKTYDFHELANLFPLMNNDEIRKLGLSIKNNKQREAIVLLDGKILDGRNRYLACHMHNIAPQFLNYKNNLGPLTFIKIKNLDRRHLSSAQKAEIALKFLRIERRRAAERQIRTRFQKEEETKQSKPQVTVGYHY